MGFTDEQKLAINIDGNNVIVSAGAGSGKTAVLTERVIRKLNDGIDIDKLLILTFTNEAANEMKSRIRNRIIKEGLDNQLNLLDSSYITTFDSFALSLVKKYHYLLNVIKDIKIVDSNVFTIYKYSVLDEIFESMYGKSDFNILIDDFCLKDDKSIKDYIIYVSDKISLLVDQNEYLDDYIDKFYSSDYIDKFIDDYILIIKSKINELRELYDDFIYYIDDKLKQKLDDWFSCLFSSCDYDSFHLFIKSSSVRFTKVMDDGIYLKELIRDKIKEITELLRFPSTSFVKDSIMMTKNYASVIIDIIKEMNEKINQYKDKYQVFEFNDISHMAIKIVRDNLSIRDELKHYFNEIMIDEYQDTSSLQEEFISYIQNDNVYMVGDIKQSIYRFRNANPYIFQDKYNKYSEKINGEKIDLIKNFRSRRETLLNINEIFNLIMDNEIGNANYFDSHNMVYGNLDYDNEDSLHDNNMEFFCYSVDTNLDYTKEEKELFIVAADIMEKIKNGYKIFDKSTSKLRDITYSDICIITDRNKYLQLYRKILEFHNIPSVIYMDEELTDNFVILVMKNLISLVYYVNTNTFNDKFRYAFTSVARSFIFEYSDNDIYHILNDKLIYNDNILKLCKQIDINLPIGDIINGIINTFMVYEKLVKLSDIEKNIVRISNLVEMADNLSSLDFSIIDFVNYLDTTIEKGLAVRYSVNTSSGNAVKLMNIHKSKGLEFSLCYFVGMHNKFTIKEVSSKFLFDSKYGMILPYLYEGELCNNIFKDLYVRDYYLAEISEKIRLLYVAMTRAREKMIIVTSIDGNSLKFNDLVPSNYRIKYRSFLDIFNSLQLVNKYVTMKEGNYTHDYDKIKLKDISLDETGDIINYKKLNISYSNITRKHFSKDNLYLLSNDDIKLMEFGTSIHETFEYADFNNCNNKYVLNLLNKIDKNYINVYHEYEFSYKIDNVLYKGIIDLMIEYADYIMIIDYKLKNIDDLNYVNQLSGYKKYIMHITGKMVNTYLYSILDDKLLEVECCE